ncbi:MAG: addiction module protein [Ottowia sp.]|nr:addiction module protein [Ottowia sp.]
MASRTIERILSEALELPEAERAELAHGLVASLDGPNDASAGGAWDDEILRRMKELETGTATTINRDEFGRRIRERLGKI